MLCMGVIGVVLCGFVDVVWVPCPSQRFHSRAAPLHSSPGRCRDLHSAWPTSGGFVTSAAATDRQQLDGEGKGREGKEGMSAQSGRKGFSQQLFATLQGAAEAAH